MRVDLHQHFWTEPLLSELLERSAYPYARREDGLTTLHCLGEQPYVIEHEARPAARRLVGLDRAVIALSSPIGIEALPRAQALALIDAHLNGVGELGGGFDAWGPLALDAVDAADVDSLIGRGCVGISIPAGAFASRAWLDRIGPALQRAAALGAPVFVHPGRAPGQRVADPSLADPYWWPALNDYVSQMQSAWLNFVTCARREHPRLVVVFALLAGGAPLLAERLLTRGGPAVDIHDADVFYDSSSYGPAALDALAALVGESQIVYGSDWPVLDPLPTPRDERLQCNAGRLVSQSAVVAA
jgi:hypothetical protein